MRFIGVEPVRWRERMPIRFDLGERPAAAGAEAGVAFFTSVNTRGVSCRDVVDQADFAGTTSNEYWKDLLGWVVVSWSVRFRFVADFKAEGSTFSESEPSEVT